MHRDLKNLYDEQKVEIDVVGTSRLKQHDKDGKGTGKHDSSRNPRQSGNNDNGQLATKQYTRRTTTTAKKEGQQRKATSSKRVCKM